MILGFKRNGAVSAALVLPNPTILYFYSRHHSQAYMVTVIGSFTAWFAARKEVMAWEYKIKPLENFDNVVIDRAFLPAGRGSRAELDRESSPCPPRAVSPESFQVKGCSCSAATGLSPNGAEPSP
ncbi:MAG: hypothetical protein M3Y08_10110 [Fibrobacterota bacterium]|nr:hypothetical protein [Fibrobacterota bacterium]